MRHSRIALWASVAMILAFLFIPIIIIMLYAFSASNVQILANSGAEFEVVCSNLE